MYEGATAERNASGDTTRQRESAHLAIKDIRMSEQQNTFQDIKTRLRPAARALLNMPDYGQIDDNLVNMSNFFSLIQPLIDAVAPSSICEIGCDQGMTTRVLKDYCKAHGCRLHAVDPVFEQSGPVDDVLHLHKCLSSEYLKNQPASEIYFLDGDHNYHTVDTELRLIHDNKPSGQPCIVFLHDVGWPWGLTDMYYDKNNIPEAWRKATAEGPLISLFEDAEPGRGLPMDGLSVALDNDGKAGVARAIQGFLIDHPQWEYTSIPSIYGLGIMMCPGSDTDAVSLRFQDIKRLFDSCKGFLAILEFNRITLLERLNHAGALWTEQQTVIQEYAATIEGLSRNLEKQAQHAGNEMANEIERLKENVSELEKKVAGMSSFSGWIRHQVRRFRK